MYIEFEDFIEAIKPELEKVVLPIDEADIPELIFILNRKAE
jgi:hypothetical protein